MSFLYFWVASCNNNAILVGFSLICLESLGFLQRNRKSFVNFLYPPPLLHHPLIKKKLNPPLFGQFWESPSPSLKRGVGGVELCHFKTTLYFHKNGMIIKFIFAMTSFYLIHSGGKVCISAPTQGCYNFLLKFFQHFCLKLVYFPAIFLKYIIIFQQRSIENTSNSSTQVLAFCCPCQFESCIQLHSACPVIER